MTENESYKPLVVIHVSTDGISSPCCEKHGAMLCVNPEATIYRCQSCNIGVDVKELHEYVLARMENLLSWAGKRKNRYG